LLTSAGALHTNSNSNTGHGHHLARRAEKGD
jgi:hypothetical protein